MTTRAPLVAIGGSITLAPGINFKISGGEIDEDIRIDDGEGLEDEGFAVPVQTGKKLMGTITGAMTANMAGIGAPIGSFQGVAFSLNFTNGIVLAGLCTVDKFKAVIKVGKLTTYSCTFESYGPYSQPVWPAS